MSAVTAGRLLSRLAPRGGNKALFKGHEARLVTTAVNNSNSSSSNVNKNCKGCKGCKGCKAASNAVPARNYFTVRRPQATSAAQAVPLTPADVPTVELTDKSVLVQWAGSAAPEPYPHVWLRDNCQCEKCFHPVSMARKVLSHKLDLDEKPVKAEFCTEQNKVLITWSDGHESAFDPVWLQDRAFNAEQRDKWHRLAKREKPVFFDGSDPIRRHNYDDIMNDDEKMLDWLNDLERVGITIVQGLGPENLTDLATKVAFPKVTHYGHYFEVVSKHDPNNLAYTSGTLGLHLDQPEYINTPGIQFLHCIHQWEMEGGDNEFTDGFKVAADLRERHPWEFQLLSTVPVYFWDVGTDEISGEFNKVKETTTLELDSSGEVRQINLSSHHRDSYISAPAELVRPWYGALKLYTEMLYAKENLVVNKMKDGECTVFDNHRVLHSRLGYRLEEGGIRRLRGCYMDWDEVYSRINVLRERLGHKTREY